MMRKFSVWLLAATMLALGLLLYGCDGDNGEVPNANEEENGDAPGDHENEEEEENKEKEEPGGEALLELENWKVPATFPEVVAMFDQLKVSYNIDGEETIFYYRFLGSETVEGQATEKVAVNVNEQEMTIWLAPEGSVVQLELLGEIVPAEDVALTGAAVVEKVVKPFARAAGCNIDQYVLEPGDNVRLAGSSQEKIGNLDGTLYTVEIKVGPPLVPEKITYACRIADLGDLQTVISLVETKDEGGAQEFRFDIEELAFR